MEKQNKSAHPEKAEHEAMLQAIQKALVAATKSGQIAWKRSSQFDSVEYWAFCKLNPSWGHLRLVLRYHGNGACSLTIEDAEYYTADGFGKLHRAVVDQVTAREHHDLKDYHRRICG